MRVLAFVNQPRHLAYQPARDHFIHAAVDAFIQNLARPVEGKQPRVKRVRRLRVDFLLPPARHAREPVDFNRANHAPHIPRRIPRRRFRVDLRQHPVQPFLAAILRGNRLQLRAQRFVRALGQAHALRERVDIQPRPAAEHRHLPARFDFLNFRGGHLAIPRRVEPRVRRQHANHVMRNAAHLSLVRRGGQDVHTPVYLHRIGGDHLSADSPAHFHRHCRLAGRGRAAHADQSFRHTRSY